MLISDGPINKVLIRCAIFGLRLIAPASIAYCIICPILRPQLFIAQPWPLPLSIWAIAETAFFCVVYLPLKSRLQEEAVHPAPPTQEQRQVLFQKCLESITEPELYFSRWFLGASMAQIKRGNLKEFYAWSFMNKGYEAVDEAEDQELDCYVDQLEEKFELDLKPGHGKAHGLRGTIEGVYMQHHPLIQYITIGLVDMVSHIRLIFGGYSYHRGSLWSSLTMLPFRPLSLLGSTSRPVPKVSYWYREHTAKDRLPVLFIHGIGVGMYAYVSFLMELNKHLASPDGEEGNVGIIAVEMLAISARICSPALVAEDMRVEIKRILQKHGWDEFVLVGHSYGSAISASMIRDHEFSDRIKAALLLDPICFMLHLPDIAYNFTRRKPTKASEYMLYYFSSQDMMISHTLARRFFWSQYILWKEDIDALPLTVTLSGQDIIVPTHAVWNYLTDSSSSTSRDQRPDPLANNSHRGRDSGTKEWDSGQLKVIWFDEFNHADLFDSKGTSRGIVKQVLAYSARFGGQNSQNGVTHGNT